MSEPISPGPQQARIAPGTRLNGIYEVDVLIAAGGMGEVYKGRTIHTNDAVAIKILRPEFGENEAALGLFRREASALHNLTHDAIVRYYVCSVDPDLQRPYLAMEFVEGRSLSQLLREGPLTFEAVRTLAQRLAAGLQAAHERRIVHRDVAPDNIIISGGDVARAKIIDFGIARWTQIGEGTIIGGGFAGKYNYVSPEQLGLFGGDVTSKSDIYSLGLVLAEALNGRPIDMGGSQAQIVEKRRKLPDLGGIDMRIRPLLEKMLQPDPADRPDAMTDIANWLTGARPPGKQLNERKQAAAARTLQAARNSGSQGRRLSRWMAAGAVLLLMIAALGAGYYYYFDLLVPPAPKTPQLPSLQTQQLEPPKLGSADTNIAAANPTIPAPTLTPAPPSLPQSPPPSLPQSPPPIAAAPPSPSPLPPPAAAAAPPPVLVPPAPAPSPVAPLVMAPPPIAALPVPSPGASPSSPQARVSRIDAITQFINNYEGGDCFFVMPISVGETAARIEGLGASIAPFEALDDAFKRANGFEPDIGLRQIRAPQCPAVTFLNRLRSQRAVAPQLEIGETNLKSGQTLAGTIDRYGNSHVELLLVADDGSVHNLTRLVRTTADGKSFNLRMQLASATGAQPQVLLAVVSARPLGSLQLSQPANAVSVFSAALSEAAAAAPVAVAARYFKLE